VEGALSAPQWRGAGRGLCPQPLHGAEGGQYRSKGPHQGRLPVPDGVWGQARRAQLFVGLLNPSSTASWTSVPSAEGHRQTLSLRIRATSAGGASFWQPPNSWRRCLSLTWLFMSRRMRPTVTSRQMCKPCECSAHSN